MPRVVGTGLQVCPAHATLFLDRTELELCPYEASLRGVFGASRVRD